MRFTFVGNYYSGYFCFILVATIAFLIMTKPAFSGPSISSVQGTLSEGQTIVIYGSGFGTHSDHNAQRDYLVSAWSNLEQGVAPSEFSHNTGPELVVGGTNQRINSSYAARGYRWSTARTYKNIWGKTITSKYMYGITRKAGSRKTIFMSAWYMFPKGFADGITYQVGDNDQTKFMMMSPGDNNKKTYFTARTQLQTNTEDGDLQESHGPLASWSPEGEWHRFDIYVNLGDRIHNWYVDGKKVPRNRELYNSPPSDFSKLSFLGYQFAGDNTHTWMQYIDDLFINFTQARVELSASSSWNETKQIQKELQIPLSWSSSSIKIRVNPGALSKDQKAYLYVVDQNGNVNASGFPVTVGLSSASSTPSAPPPTPSEAWID